MRKKYLWNAFVVFSAMVMLLGMMGDLTLAEAKSLSGKTKILSVTSVVTGKATVKFQKVKGSEGYQVQFATNKKMTKNKKTVKTTAVTTTAALKAGKKYYVRARAYSKKGKKIRYGKWSTKRVFLVAKKPAAGSPSIMITENDKKGKEQSPVMEVSGESGFEMGTIHSFLMNRKPIHRLSFFA